jgi:hypothetical protein
MVGSVAHRLLLFVLHSFKAGALPLVILGVKLPFPIVMVVLLQMPTVVADTQVKSFVSLLARLLLDAP